MKVKTNLCNLDNRWSSQIFRMLRIPVGHGNVHEGRASIHHVVRDGSAMCFWFAFWKHDTGYVEFDVRDLWAVTESVAVGQEESYQRMSHRQKLEYVTSFLQRRADDDVDIVDLVKQAHDLPFQSHAAEKVDS